MAPRTRLYVYTLSFMTDLRLEIGMKKKSKKDGHKRAEADKPGAKKQKSKTTTKQQRPTNQITPR